MLLRTENLCFTLQLSVPIQIRSISSRVMVLRAHNALQRTIRFHSDFRSDKVKELLDNPKTSIIGYDPALKTQIRLIGKSKIHHQNKNSLKAWNESQAISKKCYSVKDGSSFKAKPEIYDFHMKDIKLEDGYANFCTIEFAYHTLEFLYLTKTRVIEGVNLLERLKEN